MEFDVPSRNNDNKMAILDMKVWFDEERNIMFQNYEKPMASKNIMQCQTS